jgi:hypothetical protein
VTGGVSATRAVLTAAAHDAIAKALTIMRMRAAMDRP